MENYRKLGPRLRRFAEGIAEGLSAADAVRRIKPKARCPKQQGWKWRHLPTVSAAIEELETQAMENAGITSTRTWLEVARIAYFDHRKLVDDNGEQIPLHRLDADTVAAIAGIDVEELFSGRGEERAQIGALKKYRAWNKLDALKIILQAKKELVDRHEVTGKDGGAIEIADARERNLALVKSVASRITGAAAAGAAGADPEPDDAGGDA